MNILVSMWYSVNTEVKAILVIFEGLDVAFKVSVELVDSLGRKQDRRGANA